MAHSVGGDANTYQQDAPDECDDGQKELGSNLSAQNRSRRLEDDEGDEEDEGNQGL